MPRKTVQTYSRRGKKGVDSTSCGPWKTAVEHRHVFSDSSDTDRSHNQSGKSDSLTSHTSSISLGKENKSKRGDPEPDERSCRARRSSQWTGRGLRNKVKTVCYQDPPDFTPKYVKPKKQPLKESKVFDLLSDSSSSSSHSYCGKILPKKPPTRKNAKTGKPKASRTNKSEKIINGQSEQESEIPRDCQAELAKFSDRFNFSEFDSYSFVISEASLDCVASENVRDSHSANFSELSTVHLPNHRTPVTNPPVKVIRKSARIDTSTPNSVAPVGRCENASNSSFNCLNDLEHSPLLQCSVQLERLSLSQVEDIVASPQLFENPAASPQLCENQGNSSYSEEEVRARLFKNLQKVTRRRRNNSSFSVRSCGSKVLDSIEETFDTSQDLFSDHSQVGLKAHEENGLHVEEKNSIEGQQSLEENGSEEQHSFEELHALEEQKSSKEQRSFGEEHSSEQQLSLEEQKSSEELQSLEEQQLSEEQTSLEEHYSSEEQKSSEEHHSLEEESRLLPADVSKNVRKNAEKNCDLNSSGLKEKSLSSSDDSGSLVNGSAHPCPSYLAKDSDSTTFMTPHQTRTGRLFRKSCPRDLDELCACCDSVKNILTPIKNPRTQEVVSPKSKVLHQCLQDEFIAFEDYIVEGYCYREWSECTKIGDGVYGEVFRVVSERGSFAIKIMPIEGALLVNDEKQKSFEEILPEIVISRELSDLRYNMNNMTSGFVEVKGIRCVRGQYPEILLDQWDIYHNTRGSENDRPDLFTDDQLFILFEFEDGGRDLESFKFKSMEQAKGVLHQVTCSLAIAEQELMFEHRDLHWGNVLVRPTDKETLSYTINGEEFEIPTQGIHVMIIDFSLSRLTKDNCSVYLDLLSEDTLFQGQGDFQFEVYRMMKEATGNDWQRHCPETNIFWISYLTDKLMKEKRYPTKSQTLMRKFRAFHRNLSNFSCVFDIIMQSKFFV